MKILITNDDGYDGPGLVALYKAAREFGEVIVAPPSECHSSKGHAVCTRSLHQVTKYPHAEMGMILAVDSSPADCVRIAIEQLMSEPPDLVLAGVNPGANLGVDVYYSGTVAAAREAAIMGFRSIAVSTYMKQGVELCWDDKTSLGIQAIDRLLGIAIQPGQFWNLNFPAVEPGVQPKGLKFTRQSTEPQGVAFKPSPDQPNTYCFAGDYQSRPAGQDADVRAVFDGYVSATLLQLDTSVELSEG